MFPSAAPVFYSEKRHARVLLRYKEKTIAERVSQEVYRRARAYLVCIAVVLPSPFAPVL